MNIFVLDLDPQKAAEYHCNKHVVKMILESAQMLCTAHWTHLEKDIANKNGFKKPFSSSKRMVLASPQPTPSS